MGRCTIHHEYYTSGAETFLACVVSLKHEDHSVTLSPDQWFCLVHNGQLLILLKMFFPEPLLNSRLFDKIVVVDFSIDIDLI